MRFSEERRAIKELFQSCQQPVRSLRLRDAAIKGIPKIDLIQTQNVIETVRYFVYAVFTVLKDRSIRRKNTLEFLAIAHIRNRAFDIPIHKKLADLHVRSLSYTIRFYSFLLPAGLLEAFLSECFSEILA